MTQFTLKSSDLQPFYRNSIGIEKMFDNLLNHSHAGDNYPPYNIINVSEDDYIIELAVAGFNNEHINITVHDGQLIIKGENKQEIETNYVHQGIATRKFKRVFNLAEHVEVKNADMKNGILSIFMERIVPDSAKPKEIKIGTVSDSIESE